MSRQTYYAFGGVRTTEGTLPTDYTFTGQKRDAEGGLMYYGARYYDPGIGRFTQADTIVPNLYNPQSLNRYSYVRNNPVRYTDPTGHHEECEYPLCGKQGTGEPLPPEPPTPPKLPKESKDGETKDGKPPLPVTKGESIGPDPDFKPVSKLKSGLNVGSLTFQAGAGPWGIVQSIDVVRDESGNIWVYHTYTPTGYLGTLIGDGSMSPQVGVSYQTGFIPNLGHVGDYMGYAKVHGGSLGYTTAERVTIDPGRVEGFYLGAGISLPIASIWDLTTYSRPIAQIRPNLGWIR